MFVWLLQSLCPELPKKALWNRIIVPLLLFHGSVLSVTNVILVRALRDQSLRSGTDDEGAALVPAECHDLCIRLSICFLTTTHWTLVAVISSIGGLRMGEASTRIATTCILVGTLISIIFTRDIVLILAVVLPILTDIYLALFIATTL
jgi:hypothetical protein